MRALAYEEELPDQRLVYGALGRNIRKIRRLNRVTQEDLASWCGLSRASLCNIERGAQQVYVHHLLAIAEALETTPAKLLRGVGVEE